MRERKAVIQNAVFFTVAVIVMVLAIWFGMHVTVDYQIIDRDNLSYVPGKVVSVSSEEVEYNYEGVPKGVQELQVLIKRGDYKGQTIPVTNNLYNTHNIYAKEGTRLIICIDQPTGDGYYRASVYNYDRSLSIVLVVVIFLLLLIAVGGKGGARSGFGLVFTFIMLIFALLPMISLGVQPLLAASVILPVITVFSLIAMLGFTRKTWISIFGTLSGLIVCYLLFYAVSTIFHISGYNLEQVDALVLISYHTNIKIRDLLFVGVLSASLGAMMDVVVSVSSSVSELHTVNPELTPRQLFVSGFRIGRDIIGTMSNTLILAFAGSFLVMLMIYRINNITLAQIINLDAIAIEIAQALCGTSALILAAPATAYIASQAVTYKKK